MTSDSRPRIFSFTRELFADADTPVSIYRKLAHDEQDQPRTGTFLLESADQGIYTRYSFVGVDVFGVLSERDGKAEWIPNSDPARTVTETQLLPGGVSELAPIAALRAVYERWKLTPPPGLPPLAAGFVGYLGWESVAELENLQLSGEAPGMPRQFLGFVSDLVVIDHHTGSVTLIANTVGTAADPAETGRQHPLWGEAQQRLDRMQRALAQPSAPALGTLDHSAVPQPTRGMSAEDYHRIVRVAKAHIVDGDIFQVVPAQRFEQECSAAPLDVYRVLRHLNPSPYMYLLAGQARDGKSLAVVGSSPEALLTVTDGRVVTHPIAGSRPRGTTAEEDLAFEKEMLADPKERSEHIMLVDLARNDLSRVCRPGTVEVSEFMFAERFSHIMHISSIVEGDLREDLNPVDALSATFPAGTLSGAPKPWALRIIDELEPVRRGIYGGVVGYIGLGGQADLAIAIRTATIHNGVATVQAGAGVVADSVETLEEEESRNKAAAPLRAVAIANTLTPVAETAPSAPSEAGAGE